MATKVGTLLSCGLLSVATGLGGGALLGLSGCETDDPCARRQAACIEVTLVGKRDDGNGNPIAYRGLSVQVFAPNLNGPQTQVTNKCAMTPAGMGMVGHAYGGELGPVGTMLASTTLPDLVAVAPYSAAVQGKVAFQLPDSFNDLPDNKPADAIDPLPSDADKVAKLKQLRDQDPRALRILVLQAGQPSSAWDSRCDEELFSSDEWTMKTYYRVGHNEDRGVMAFMEGAQTSTP